MGFAVSFHFKDGKGRNIMEKQDSKINSLLVRVT